MRELKRAIDNPHKFFSILLTFLLRYCRIVIRKGGIARYGR